MYEKLPQELKERGAFCLWRYEQRNGDTTKVPYQTNGLRGDSTNRATFTDYASVIGHTEDYDGIGIGVFDDICAIDIDHCVENGTLSDLAKDIIARMDSYAEYSPSGSGVRILFRAVLPAYDRERYYINNRRLSLEIYVAGYTNRFVTVTGNAISGSDIEERADALADVLERYMKRPEKATAKVSAPGSYLSDTSVLAKASSSKQAEKFNALWSGQVPDGKSHSEADAALCAMLAFWCGGDTDQMDRLFRQSGLYREKWEREDYRTNTLTGAVSMCSDFYRPTRKSAAAEDFNDLQQAVGALTPAENDRYSWNDIGNGRLFADVYKDIARYVPERKQWFIYDGTRWVPDTGALKAMELCKDLADAVMKYALGLHDEHKRKSYIDFCRKWQSRHVRITILSDAQSVYPISMEDFDSDKYLFNCANGTIDLRTMEFREHSPEDRLTKIAPVDYLPNARSERFDRFIREIMSGDMSKTRFLQKSVGYQVRARGWTHEQEHFVCATYRKIKGGCTSHQIHNVQVEKILLRELRQITTYAREHEDEFIELVTKQNTRRRSNSRRHGCAGSGISGTARPKRLPGRIFPRMRRR